MKRDYKFYEEALTNGRIKFSKKNNYILIHNEYIIKLSRVVWILTHPDEILYPWNEIHHKDGNPRNDDWENLEKIATGFEHKVVHTSKNGLSNIDFFNAFSPPPSHLRRKWRILPSFIQSQNRRHSPSRLFWWWRFQLKKSGFAEEI